MSYSEVLGSLTLSTVCTDVVIEDEGGGSFLPSMYRTSHRDGMTHDPQGSRGPMDIALRLVIDTSSEGHLNLSKIKKELAGSGLVTLTRTVPDVGNLRALVRQFAPMVRGEAHNVYRLFLTIPSGSWQDAAESSQSAGSVSTSGDVRIHDPIIVFASATTLTHTAADGTQSAITVAAGPTFPVTVYMAGTDGSSPFRAVDDNGDDARGYVTKTRPWGIRMDPDGAQTFSGSATVKWRNRWG